MPRSTSGWRSSCSLSLASRDSSPTWRSFPYCVGKSLTSVYVINSVIKPRADMGGARRMFISWRSLCDGTLLSHLVRSELGGDSIALKCAGGDDGGDVLVLGGVGGDD